MDRIDQANELFISEGRPGFMTDRGRIYILFGPPTNRIQDTSGYRYCREVWYYGNFPVVFDDSTCSGDYRLVTYNLRTGNYADHGVLRLSDGRYPFNCQTLAVHPNGRLYSAPWMKKLHPRPGERTDRHCDLISFPDPLAGA